MKAADRWLANLHPSDRRAARMALAIMDEEQVFRLVGRPRGRPLTDDSALVVRVCDMVRAGVPLQRAAAQVAADAVMRREAGRPLSAESLADKLRKQARKALPRHWQISLRPMRYRGPVSPALRELAKNVGEIGRRFAPIVGSPVFRKLAEMGPALARLPDMARVMEFSSAMNLDHLFVDEIIARFRMVERLMAAMDADDGTKT